MNTQEMKGKICEHCGWSIDIQPPRQTNCNHIHYPEACDICIKKEQPQKDEGEWEKERARLIYEATRVEAEWSERSIVPEQWEIRDEKFREQFVDIINTYLLKEKLPTPEEAHQSWMDSYFKMGWKYGKKRDIVKKTHPDLLPFNELPKDEKDKDAIFLVFVWLMKNIISQALSSQEERIREKVKKMKGLTKNPDYYIELKDRLNGNIAMKGISNEQFTQIAWEAKDLSLEHVLTLLAKRIESITNYKGQI